MSESMRVEQLSVTPVKSLAVHHPDHVDLGANGVEGDRAFYLIDDTGKIVNCTALGDLLRYRADYDSATGRLEVHGPEGLVQAGYVEEGDGIETDFYGLRSVAGNLVVGWDEVFSGIAGFPLRLVRGQTAGFDVAGVTLIATPSLVELASRNEAEPVDARRFRMNIEISGSAALAEDTWEDRHLRLGSAVVRVGGLVLRCAATTRDPDTGVVDLKTLEMIGKLKGRQETATFGKGFYFGVYAHVVDPGRVSVGDSVTLL
ncbi:MAG: MOSC domain-containing protein [bacterium]|nr:MOSC domain-containing protein [bacterium]